MSLFLPFFGGDFRGKEDLIHNFTDGCVSKVQNLDFCLIGQKTKDFFSELYTDIYLAFGALWKIYVTSLPTNKHNFQFKAGGL